MIQRLCAFRKRSPNFSLKPSIGRTQKCPWDFKSLHGRDAFSAWKEGLLLLVFLWCVSSGGVLFFGDGLGLEDGDAVVHATIIQIIDVLAVAQVTEKVLKVKESSNGEPEGGDDADDAGFQDEDHEEVVLPPIGLPDFESI